MQGIQQIHAILYWFQLVGLPSAFVFVQLLVQQLQELIRDRRAVRSIVEVGDYMLRDAVMRRCVFVRRRVVPVPSHERSRPSHSIQRRCVRTQRYQGPADAVCLGRPTVLYAELLGGLLEPRLLLLNRRVEQETNGVVWVVHDAVLPRLPQFVNSQKHGVREYAAVADVARRLVVLTARYGNDLLAIPEVLAKIGDCV